MATEQQPLKRSKNGSRTRDANGSWQPSEQAGPRSIPEPGMLIPQESHESGTLQSTLQPLGHDDRAVGGAGQQAVPLQRAMREVLDAPNAVSAEEPTSPSSPPPPMRRVSLSVDDGSGTGPGVRESLPDISLERSAQAGPPSPSFNQVWGRRDSGKGWDVGAANDGQADVLLVDTTGDGVADTLVQIYGVGQQGGPQQSKPPRRQSAAPQSAAPRQASAPTPTATATARPTPTAAATTLGPRGTGQGTAQPGRSQPKPGGDGKQGWTEEEDAQIVSTVLEIGEKWSQIAKELPGRTDDAVRNRYKRLQKKKIAVAEVPDKDTGGGSASSDAAGPVVTSADLLSMDPAKRGDMWSPAEDATIIEGVRMHGLKWETIEKMLPGRSANAVRNRYLRIQPQHADAPLKKPQPRKGPTNALHRHTAQAPLQQTYPPLAAAHTREDGLHPIGRAPPQPPPNQGWAGRQPAGGGGGGGGPDRAGFPYGMASEDLCWDVGAYGATDDAYYQNLADIQNLLGSDPEREVERSTAGMTTGLFG